MSIRLRNKGGPTYEADLLINCPIRGAGSYKRRYLDRAAAN